MWSSSWLAGVSAPDDVIDALHEWAPMHLVVAGDEATAAITGLSHPSPRDDGAAGLLTAIRQTVPRENTDAGIELKLPRPGSVSGLPLGGDFTHHAINAGEAVVVGVVGETGLGIVPSHEGPDVLRWTVFAITVPASSQREYGLGEAEYSMRDAVRGAAEAIGSLQLLPTGAAELSQREMGDPRVRIAEEFAELSRHRYPADMSERALRVLESADRVAAILTVAEHSSPTEPSTAAAAAAREELLRPLWSAVLSARLTAVATSIESSLHTR